MLSIKMKIRCNLCLRVFEYVPINSTVLLLPCDMAVTPKIQDGTNTSIKHEIPCVTMRFDMILLANYFFLTRFRVMLKFLI